MSLLSEPQAAELLKQLVILYVEDNATERAFVFPHLQHLAATVFEAANLTTALTLFEQHRPQLVISGLNPPQLDGLALCSAIRGLEPDVGFVILSNYGQSHYILTALNLGVDRYLVQPVTLETLRGTLLAMADKIDKKRQIARQMQLVRFNLFESEYQQEKIKNYVAKYFGRMSSHGMREADYINIPKEDISGDFVCAAQFGTVRYFLIADGAGHGLAAVMPALQVPKIFKEQAEQGFSLITIAAEINRQLHAQRLPDHFVAATLVCINSSEHFIEVLNCANPAAILVDEEGQINRSFRSCSPALGMVSNELFEAEAVRIVLDRPATLYVFSDGLTDTLQAIDPNLDCAALLNSCGGGDIFACLTQLFKDNLPSKQVDDITLLRLDYKPETRLVNEASPAITQQAGSCCTTSSAFDWLRLKRLNALYIGDNAQTVEGLNQALKKRLGSLHLASSGDEGLGLFLSYQPQVVLIDIDDTALNGFGLVNTLRGLNREVLLIFVGSALAGTAAASLFEFELNGFIYTPIDAAQALNTLRRVVESRECMLKRYRAASVFEYSSMAITITDHQRNIVAVNPAFTQITGYSSEEVLGKNPRLLSSGKHDESFYRRMWQALETTGTWSGEIWNRRKSGDLYFEWLTINVVKDDQQQPLYYIAVFADVSERKAALDKIQYLANYDSLTHLPNRALFMDRLKLALLYAQRKNNLLALSILNLDNFNAINEALGHAVGDQLLNAVAQRLTACVRESDTICRLGIDEFAILLPDLASGDIAAAIIGKIRQSFALPFEMADKELEITASIGISLYPQDGKDSEIIIRHADSAMRQVKKTGKNGFSYFNRQIEQQTLRYAILQQEMRKALRNKEFYLQYQPKYSMRADHIIGSEALVRWNSRAAGIVSPAEFIPIAEHTGFIIELSEWIIDQVCQQIHSWRTQGLKLFPVSINISPLHFQRGGLVACLQACLARWTIAPKLVYLELTEGMVMNHTEEAIETLQQLKTLGFHISVDDFGTGFSCLNSLCRLPIDELKIDRSFIMEIADDPDLTDARKSTIPSAIIQLAKGLNLDLVAEGVETATQREFLLKNGCDVIQGYIISRPLDADKFAEFLR